MDNLPANSLRTGRFISESKNRFLYTVEIDGVEEICYIASSCRLDNFLDLRGKSVLLCKNKGEAKATKYSVLGVKYKRSYILLNTSWANNAIGGSLHSKRFSYLGKRSEIKKEYLVNGYKTDFFIPTSKTIIEVKSVISTCSTALFPTVFSERTLHQLAVIEKLLESGFKAVFIVVSLNPYASAIRLNKDTECYSMLKRCMNAGLLVKGYSCRFRNDGTLHIEHELPVLSTD